MNCKLVFQGFPGKMTTGSLGWGAMTYVESDEGKKIIIDTAGPAKRVFLKERLRNLEISEKEIDILIFTHFHYDHVYNYDYFPNAKIVMSKVEGEWVEGNTESYAIPPHYYSAIREKRIIEFVDREQEILPGISILMTPGHTPGSISVLLNGRGMENTIVAGDAVKNIAELRNGVINGGWNSMIGQESIKKIRSIAQIVIPGHDRILRVNGEDIEAITNIDEKIILPEGVTDKVSNNLFSLYIPSSSKK